VLESMQVKSSRSDASSFIGVVARPIDFEDYFYWMTFRRFGRFGRFVAVYCVVAVAVVVARLAEPADGFGLVVVAPESSRMHPESIRSHHC
jgi:hypothetical protein